MNDRLKHVSSRHRQKNLNFYKWTSLFCLSLALISGSVLIYQWWEKQKLKIELEEKNKREFQQYELQKNHLISINSLSQNPNIHQFLLIYYKLMHKNLLIIKTSIFPIIR